MSRIQAQKFLTKALNLNFPYVEMGRIDSLHLFGESELMILQLYEHNKDRWHYVVDIGANLGLHSIMMDRLGWCVRAYEPDPIHFTKLMDNLKANEADNVHPLMAAVSTKNGTANFIRVLNNLTGSHLEGFKDSYGPKEELVVATVDCRELWKWADFAKIDSEGNEAELCLTMTPQEMTRLSAVMEVRNTENARKIYEHFSGMHVPLWSQKIDWRQVDRLDDMPKANREGSLFVGHRGPWA